MQDQNEDTEWNDILRAKGIIPEKPKENEITEDEIMAIMDKAIKDKSGGKPNKVQLFWEGHKNCAIVLMVLTFTL